MADNETELKIQNLQTSIRWLRFIEWCKTSGERLEINDELSYIDEVIKCLSQYKKELKKEGTNDGN